MNFRVKLFASFRPFLVLHFCPKTGLHFSLCKSDEFLQHSEDVDYWDNEKLDNMGSDSDYDSNSIRAPLLHRWRLKGLTYLLETNLEKGIQGDAADLMKRRNAFGSNTYPRKKGRSVFLGSTPPIASDHESTTNCFLTPLTMTTTKRVVFALDGD
ncbi:uncharacterized protein LOC115962840 [Quercus lobata]|uniref:uncharacterized protein LOC115962840 n=1 Tax=Quercus lobata TaxID=97700 RepID=UPI00124505F9|nr:uncharacterized protein LOC115962840 [Quercus lobata]